MPRGSFPGERRGGRKAGTPNKATQERLELHARAIAVTQKSGGKLGREVLDELTQIAMGMATQCHQEYLAAQSPAPPHGARDREVHSHAANVCALEHRFQKWLEITGVLAKSLAPFQSPTFKAIAVVPPSPQAPPPKPDDGKVIGIDDPAALARLYQQMIGKVQRAS